MISKYNSRPCSNKSISYEAIRIITHSEYNDYFNKIRSTLKVLWEKVLISSCETISEGTITDQKVDSLIVIARQLRDFRALNRESLLRFVLRAIHDFKLIEDKEVGNLRSLLACKDEESIKVGLAILMSKVDLI